MESQVAKLQRAVVQRKEELLQAVRAMDQLVAHAASLELQQHTSGDGANSGGASPQRSPGAASSDNSPHTAAHVHRMPAEHGHVAFSTPGKPHVAATPMSATPSQTPARVAPASGYHTPAGAVAGGGPASSRRKGRSTAKKRFGLLATHA